MDDDFYDPIPETPTAATPGLLWYIINCISAAPLAFFCSVAFAPFFVIIAARLLLVGQAYYTRINDEGGRAAPISPNVWEKFFGIPKRSRIKYVKYREVSTLAQEWTSCLTRSKELVSHESYLMKEPHLGIILSGFVRELENNIPQMITFAESEVDLQPWERWANSSHVSDAETDINMMSLLRDMMGHASIPGLFGRSLIEKYPYLLHDMYNMDLGFSYFSVGLPAWTPWPDVSRAHQARARVWGALDDHQRALDLKAEGKNLDPLWGDLDDVSDFILKRNETFREGGFEITERGDINILWALVMNSSVAVYWHLLHILSTPGLSDRIRLEIAPFAKVSKPVSIGKFSSVPNLELSYKDLAENCKLLRSTYFETLRLCDQALSVRKIDKYVVLPEDISSNNDPTLVLREGEPITNSYKRDQCLKDLENMETNQPCSDRTTMCQVLALVAGILVFWDIEPAGKIDGWVVPKKKKASGISLPVKDTRVRIKRRDFDWKV